MVVLIIVVTGVPYHTALYDTVLRMLKYGLLYLWQLLSSVNIGLPKYV